MMFSSYRNPPYRKPTTARSTSPPARNPSPKRKRPDMLNEPPALQIDTQRLISDAASESGGDSPRTAVAERLSDLNLQHFNDGREPTPQTPERSDWPRKRFKRSPPLPQQFRALSSPGGEDVTRVASSRPGVRSDPPVADGGVRWSSAVERLHEMPMIQIIDFEPGATTSFSTTRAKDEVGETPGCRTTARSSPPLPSDKSHAPKRKQDEISTSSPDPQLLRSPPSHHRSPGATIDHSVSPTKLPDDHSSDQSWLTWHDDEITGHEIDTKADDDGEGINGIGFRPTPAIAAARSQRRRQQVNEWRAREAREARQKRFERRRGVNGEGTSEHVHKRTVRFMTE